MPVQPQNQLTGSKEKFWNVWNFPNCVATIDRDTVESSIHHVLVLFTSTNRRFLQSCHKGCQMQIIDLCRMKSGGEEIRGMVELLHH